MVTDISDETMEQSKSSPPLNKETSHSVSWLPVHPLKIRFTIDNTPVYLSQL
jgi:hypothetical protein